MRTLILVVRRVVMRTLVVVVMCLFASPVHAITVDIPGAGQVTSGISVISAWDCLPGVYTVEFDAGSILTLSYGSERLDTPCAAPDNGIVSIFNYNLLGDGAHVADFFRDGVLIATVDFEVVTAGVEFLTGVSGTGMGTLSNGQEVTLEWSQGAQAFIATQFTQQPGTSVLCGTQTATVPETAGSGGGATWVVTNPCDGETLSIAVTPLTSDGYFVCVTSQILQIVQDGVLYMVAGVGDFFWLDSSSAGFCGPVAFGATKQSTVISQNVLALNFSEPFEIFYDDQLLFEFR